MSAIANGPASGESPNPRASTAITRRCAASASARPAQVARVSGNGCSSTSAGPVPRSSYPIGVAPELAIAAGRYRSAAEKENQPRCATTGARPQGRAPAASSLSAVTK